MKKLLVSLFLICTIVCSVVTVGATAQQIIIDGTVADIPAEMGVIQERDDRTFVPIRFVMEFLGCTVNYNDLQESATITDSKGVSYLVRNDSNQLFSLGTIESKLYNMDTKVFIEDVMVDGQAYGRMYIPVRFLAEAIGYKVDWDEATETVSIYNAQ